MLPDGTDTTVAQVVDIVHLSLGVDQLNQIADDGDDVLVGEHARFHGDVQIQFLVNTITAHFAEIVTFVGEEELVQRGTGRLLVGSRRALQLQIDVVDSLTTGVGRVFLQRIEDHRVVNLLLVRLVEEHRLDVRIRNHVDVLFLKNGLAVDDHFGTLDVDDLTGFVIDEVLTPCLGDSGGELLA